MRGILRTGATAVASLVVALPVIAGKATPVRAEVAASEVLTWCSGANQSGQLGAINAFRCVNYLQGAADMIRALSTTDLDACLDGGQSAGAQLMARFIPDLKARASQEDVDATPMARHVANWLANDCAVELTLASDIGTDPETTLDQGQALAEAQADLAEYQQQVTDLQAALQIAATSDSEELAACNASLETLNQDLATAEAQAADFGMQVSELSLELEADNAEATARRQEIAEAEERIAALNDELEAAITAKLAAESALNEARHEVRRLTAEAEEGAAQSAAVEQVVVTAAQRVAAMEADLADATSRADDLEAQLADSQDLHAQLVADLQDATATAADRASRIIGLEQSLESCQITVASTDTPTSPVPPLPPSRTAPAPTPPSPTPNIVTTPGTSITSQSNASTITRVVPRQLDAIGIQALRQMQQATLRQGAIGQRRSWSTPDGRFTGYVMVLSEGYRSPAEFCREIYSEAVSSGSVVHQGTDIYCRQANNLWVYKPPGS